MNTKRLRHMRWYILGVLLCGGLLLATGLWWTHRSSAIVWSTDDLRLALAFSVDGQAIAVAEAASSAGKVTNLVRLRHVPDGSVIHTFVGATTAIFSLAFSPDNQYLAAGGNSFVWLWQVRDGRLLHTIPTRVDGPRDSRVTQLVFSADGQTVTTATQDGALRVWQVQDGRLLTTLGEPKEGVFQGSVALSPDGRFVADWQDDNIVVWSVRDRQVVMRVRGGSSGSPANGGSGLVFSPDGQILAALIGDKSIDLWRVREQVLIESLDGHTDNVNSIAFSRDGQKLATASGMPYIFPSQQGDRTIRLWSTSDGTPLATLRTSAAEVLALDFSPNGNFLASGSLDKVIRLWEVK